MISSTSADFRRAVQRLISSSITALIDVSFARLHLSRFSLGHYRSPAGCRSGYRPSSWQDDGLRGQTRKVGRRRSEEHTSELQSLMRSSYAVFCLKKKKNNTTSRKFNHNSQTKSAHHYST